MFPFFLLPFVFNAVPIFAEDCVCTEDGISNGIQTGTVGCTFNESYQATCFVSVTESCPDPMPSLTIRGATYINCTTTEAVFDAAKKDDVEAFGFLRWFTFLKAEGRIFDDLDFSEREYSLVSYAASYGSFNVVENLLLYRDYECNYGVPLDEVLCRFSNATHCEPGHPSRQAIESLINYVYTRECAPERYVLQKSLLDPIMITTSGTKESAKDRKNESDKGFSNVSESLESSFPKCGEHPYFVSIRSTLNGGYKHLCSGVLIERYYVMTAAHCVRKDSGYVLVIGPQTQASVHSENCHDTREVRLGQFVYFHPGWKRNEYSKTIGNDRDIALINLNENSKKRPIKLSSQMAPAFGEELEFIGLRNDDPNVGFAEALKRVESIEVMDTSVCEEMYPRGVGDEMICAGGHGHDYCYEDEGGPLIRKKDGKNKLVGIAHLKEPSLGCGQAPGLYVNASKVEKWMQHVIGH